MKERLLVIVGPTSVGKTAVSIHLAKQFQGEIVSCDSMQIYRGMDIGTAKASLAERAQVPHHLIDIISPNELFTMQDFQQLARQKIHEVHHRDHLPILTGGTGLYIEAVTYDYRVPPAAEDRPFRVELQRVADEQGNLVLHQRLSEVDPISANKLHPNDVKRVIRALEVYEATGKPFSSYRQARKAFYDQMTWIGLTMPRVELYERINQRVDQMMAQGWIDEVARLQREGFQDDLTSMQAIGYKEILHVFDGTVTIEEATQQIKQNTRKYAKRQLSWFRRMRNIHWFDVTKNEVSKEIQQFVAGKFIVDRE